MQRVREDANSVTLEMIQNTVSATYNRVNRCQILIEIHYYKNHFNSIISFTEKLFSQNLFQLRYYLQKNNLYLIAQKKCINQYLKQVLSPICEIYFPFYWHVPF